jgi:transposase-like protein
MSQTREVTCPECGNTQFWKTASMEVHLGTKTKWACSDCKYAFIEIENISSLSQE